MNQRTSTIITALSIAFGIMCLIALNSEKKDVDFYQTKYEESQIILSQMEYRMDTLEISLEISKNHTKKLKNEYEQLSQKRGEINEEHHQKIIASPDTLSVAFLYRIAQRYRGQLGYPKVD